MDSLFYTLDRLFHITSIPVRVIDNNGENVNFRRGYTQELDPLSHGELKTEMCQMADFKPKPFLKADINICTYGVMKDSTGCVIIMGPVMLVPMSKQEVAEYAHRHKIFDKGFTISTKTILELNAIMVLLFFMRTGEQLVEPDVIIEWDNGADNPVSEADVNSFIMQSVEDDVRHIDYQTEFLYLKQIREGDIEGISTEMDPNFSVTNIGRMAIKSIKHFEYMICSSITLATRAAIDGGVDPTLAYSISDLYLQRLERCNTVDDFIALQFDMKIAYAKQVRKAKETRSQTSYVEKCKTFIANHLNKPFDLDDLAKELGVNKSHLSRKFKEEMGVGIMHYTQVQRIETACNMLKYSGESISTIANYLYFASQSHFGIVFKKHKGMSPKKYREMEQIV